VKVGNKGRVFKATVPSQIVERPVATYMLTRFLFATS
jgi:hypothetical protein